MSLQSLLVEIDLYELAGYRPTNSFAKVYFSKFLIMYYFYIIFTSLSMKILKDCFIVLHLAGLTGLH